MDLWIRWVQRATPGGGVSHVVSDRHSQAHRLLHDTDRRGGWVWPRWRHFLRGFQPLAEAVQLCRTQRFRKAGPHHILLGDVLAGRHDDFGKAS